MGKLLYDSHWNCGDESTHFLILQIARFYVQEDHYRLFEALISGAMVMMDKMLSLPKGLEHGVSVVEFTSEDDLRSKILYYKSHDDERLAIAAAGRKVAMDRHRSWHRMEEVIFGDVMSRCQQRSHGAEDCPYVVHAPGSDGASVKDQAAKNRPPPSTPRKPN